MTTETMIKQDNENESRIPDLPLEKRISVSPEEAAALTGIGVTRIREAAAAGALGAHKHGRRVIILRDDLILWIKTMPSAAKEAA